MLDAPNQAYIVRAEDDFSACIVVGSLLVPRPPCVELLFQLGDGHIFAPVPSVEPTEIGSDRVITPSPEIVFVRVKGSTYQRAMRRCPSSQPLRTLGLFVQGSVAGVPFCPLCRECNLQSRDPVHGSNLLSCSNSEAREHRKGSIC